jgi:hypothetical protein
MIVAALLPPAIADRLLRMRAGTGEHCAHKLRTSSPSAALTPSPRIHATEQARRLRSRPPHRAPPPAEATTRAVRGPRIPIGRARPNVLPSNPRFLLGRLSNAGPARPTTVRQRAGVRNPSPELALRLIP